ncbi:MAG: nicotinate phosphoribosyltransferase [Coriobacteriaceae bacterium]
MSIRMAKEQGLSLNPQKISGLCGRLMCCLRYEFDAYKDFKGRAPKLNATVQTPAGPAKVVDHDVPREIVSLKVEGEKPVKVPLSEFDPAPEGATRPNAVGEEAWEEATSDRGLIGGEALIFSTSQFTGADKLAEGAKVRHTGGSRKGIRAGGALAPRRLRGPRARRLALGGDAGGVSGTGRPAPQAPPLHEAVGGRRRGAGLERVSTSREEARAAKAASPKPRRQRSGTASRPKDARAPGRRPQPERPGQSGQPGKAQRARGSQGRSLRPGDGKPKGASPRPGQSSGLRAERGGASRSDEAKADTGASKPRRRRRSRKPKADGGSGAGSGPQSGNGGNGTGSWGGTSTHERGLRAAHRSVPDHHGPRATGTPRKRARRPASPYFTDYPFKGGYAVACGMAQLADLVETFRFSEEDIAYLASLDAPLPAALFDPAFLEYLRDLRLSVDIDACARYDRVPHEPLVRVTGPIMQCQLIETALLNMVNFQTLIATKAARVCRAAKGRPVAEFGLRRAQGLGGVWASRAAVVGGCSSTSNVLAGKLFSIPVSGTHAHSWVMSFDDELTAFREYARIFPNNCILLVDTYDVEQGIRNAITVGLEMRERGERLAGIRIDSGDLSWLSKMARRMLDEAGLTDCGIVLSNDLDEYTIQSMLEEGADVMSFGVGTKLASAYDQPTLGGVYKLAAVRAGEDAPWTARLKISESAAKLTTPGVLDVRSTTSPMAASLATWSSM